MTSATPVRSVEVPTAAWPRRYLRKVIDSDEVRSARPQRCLEAARSWEQRVGFPDKIEPQSSLDKDDEGLSGNPVRSAAWAGLYG